MVLLCRPRRDARCHCQTCIVTVLMLLVLLCLCVSGGLVVAYLQLRKELDVIRNRLVTGAVHWIKNCCVRFLIWSVMCTLCTALLSVPVVSLLYFSIVECGYTVIEVFVCFVSQLSSWTKTFPTKFKTWHTRYLNWRKHCQHYQRLIYPGCRKILQHFILMYVLREINWDHFVLFLGTF